MAALDLFIIAKHHGLIEGMRTPAPRAEGNTVAVQARRIFLPAQHVVRSLLLTLPRALPLAPHCLEGHHGASQMQHAEPLGEGGALVGFRVYFELCAHSRLAEAQAFTT